VPQFLCSAQATAESLTPSQFSALNGPPIAAPGQRSVATVALGRSTTRLDLSPPPHAGVQKNNSGMSIGLQSETNSSAPVSGVKMLKHWQRSDR